MRLVRVAWWRPPRAVVAAVAASLTLGLGAARAGEPVIVNGQEVDPATLAGRTLRGAEVTTRADGRVVITVPGYRWEGGVLLAPGEVVPAMPSWWLLVEDVDSSGMTMDVVINGRPIQRVVSSGRHVLVDLRGVLSPGRNDVRLDVSGGGTGRMAATVGLGRAEGGLVALEADAPRYVVTARDLGSLSFTVDAPARTLSPDPARTP